MMEIPENHNIIQEKEPHRGKLLFFTTLLLFSISLLIILIYHYSFNTSVRKSDVDFEYMVYDEKVIIKITPRVNIKNFEYSIDFYNSEKNIQKSIDYVKSNETIIHTYNENEIKQKYLKSDREVDNISLKIKGGTIQNKNAGKIYETIDKNDCTFKFELSTIQKYYYNDIRYPFDDEIIICYVTNNTNHAICSLQNFSVNIDFEDDITADVNLDDIFFAEPLYPNRTMEIIIDDFSGTWGADSKTIKEKYNNSIKSNSYAEQKYTIVYKNHSLNVAGASKNTGEDVLPIISGVILITIMIVSIVNLVKIKKKNGEVVCLNAESSQEINEMKIQEKAVERNNDMHENNHTEENQTYTSPSNTCKICGLPSDVYEVCRQCQIRINRGDIIKCQHCGSYHLKGMQCICRGNSENFDQHRQDIKVEVNNNEHEEESAFEKGFKGSLGCGCGVAVFIFALIAIIFMAIFGGFEAMS